MMLPKIMLVMRAMSLTLKWTWMRTLQMTLEELNLRRTLHLTIVMASMIMHVSLSSLVDLVIQEMIPQDFLTKEYPCKKWCQ